MSDEATDAPRTPLDVAASDFLPGLEHESMLSPMSQAQIARLPAYTAEHLFSNDPERYALAARLFFGSSMSQRMVCAHARISGHTLASIISRECKGTTAARWREAMSGDLRAITAMALSVSGEMLADPKACKAAGLRGVAAILRECTNAHEVLQGRLPPKDDSPRHDAEAAARDYLAQMRRANAGEGQSILAGEKIEERGAQTESAGVEDASMAEVESDT